MKKSLILIVLLTVYNLAYSVIPTGYYQRANNKYGKELLDSLNSICSDGKFLSYGSGIGHTWNGFFHTDRRASDSVVIDMYSNIKRKQADSTKSVDKMHIEHSLPKSWWGGIENNAFKDLNHLFPADGSMNISKSNHPLGIVTSTDPKEVTDNGVAKTGPNAFPNAPTTERCFEPADEYKGDFARAYFYMSTIYNEFSDLWNSPMMDNNTYPVWKPWALDLLLEWHRQDPVSEKERIRLEEVYSIQHNRNPFIDYPEMVEHIWGEKKENPIVLPEENRPYLMSPTKWDNVELPISHVSTTANKDILFKGANIKENVTIELKLQCKGITLSKSQLTPQEITEGKMVTISFTSDKIATLKDTIHVIVPLETTKDTIRIPVKATFTNEFMITNAEAIDQVSARIGWTEVGINSDYTVKITQGEPTEATDLIFSAYVEGSSYNKAVSLYNGSEREIDLSYYTIKKQNNGTGEFAFEFELNGKIAPKSTYVIVNSQAGVDLKNLADSIAISSKESAFSFNGNDALGLYHNGILIDVIGEIDNPNDWGKDISLERKSTVNSPNAAFDWNEWSQYKKDDFSHLKAHTMDVKENANEAVTYTQKGNNILIDGLAPNNIYNVVVLCGDQTTVNIGIVRTPNLNTPDAYEATDVSSKQFTANWEVINHAEEYEIELIQLEGTGITTIEENFDTIKSNGEPLPTGWTGNASGHYDTKTSSGKSPNSLALKNDGEWIQTILVSSPMVHFEFMYRFPSSGKNASGTSNFIVYKIDAQGKESKLDSVAYTNTQKTTKTYTPKELGDNCYAVKIVYNKFSGNLAIDDVIYKYGGSKENILRRETTYNNFFTFYNLENNTEYRYRVKAIYGKGTNNECNSDCSNIIIVKTSNKDVPTSLEINHDKYILYTEGHNVFIVGEDINNICIYNINGMRVYEGTERMISIEQNGIYLARITDGKESYNLKFSIK